MPQITVIPIAVSHPPLEITDLEGMVETDCRHVTPDDLGTAFDDIACTTRLGGGGQVGVGGGGGGVEESEGQRERQGQRDETIVPIRKTTITNGVDCDVSKKIPYKKGSTLHKEENDEKVKEREKERERERGKEGIKTRACNILGDIIAAEISTVTLPLTHPIILEKEKEKEREREREKEKALRIEKTDLGSDSTGNVTVLGSLNGTVNGVKNNGSVSNSNEGDTSDCVRTDTRTDVRTSARTVGCTGTNGVRGSDVINGTVKESITGGTAPIRTTTIAATRSVCGTANASHSTTLPTSLLSTSPPVSVTAPTLVQPVVEGGRKRRNSVSSITTAAATAAAGTIGTTHTTQGQTDTTQSAISSSTTTNTTTTTAVTATVVGTVVVNTRKYQKRRNTEDMSEKDKECSKEVVKQPKEVEKSRAKMRYTESEESATQGVKANILGSAENWKKNCMSSSKKRILCAIEDSVENGEMMGRKTLNFDTKKSTKEKEKEGREKERRNDSSSEVAAVKMDGTSYTVGGNGGMNVGLNVGTNMGVGSVTVCAGGAGVTVSVGCSKVSGSVGGVGVGMGVGVDYKRKRGDSVMSGDGNCEKEGERECDREREREGDESATTGERYSQSQDDFRYVLPYCTVSCYVVSCYVMPYYIVLSYCVVSSYVVSCYVMPYYIVLSYCVVSSYVVHRYVMRYYLVLPYCVVSSYVVHRYVMRYYLVLSYCVVSSYVVSCYVVLYCCFVLRCSMLCYGVYYAMSC
jgi:hypothetical protein